MPYPKIIFKAGLTTSESLSMLIKGEIATKGEIINQHKILIEIAEKEETNLFNKKILSLCISLNIFCYEIASIYQKAKKEVNPDILLNLKDLFIANVSLLESLKKDHRSEWNALLGEVPPFRSIIASLFHLNTMQGNKWGVQERLHPFMRDIGNLCSSTTKESTTHFCFTLDHVLSFFTEISRPAEMLSKPAEIQELHKSQQDNELIKIRSYFSNLNPSSQELKEEHLQGFERPWIFPSGILSCTIELIQMQLAYECIRVFIQKPTKPDSHLPSEPTPECFEKKAENNETSWNSKSLLSFTSYFINRGLFPRWMKADSTQTVELQAISLVLALANHYASVFEIFLFTNEVHDLDRIAFQLFNALMPQLSRQTIALLPEKQVEDFVCKAIELTQKCDTFFTDDKEKCFFYILLVRMLIQVVKKNNKLITLSKYSESYIPEFITKYLSLYEKKTWSSLGAADSSTFLKGLKFLLSEYTQHLTRDTAFYKLTNSFLVTLCQHGALGEAACFLDNRNTYDNKLQQLTSEHTFYLGLVHMLFFLLFLDAMNIVENKCTPTDLQQDAVQFNKKFSGEGLLNKALQKYSTFISKLSANSLEQYFPGLIDSLKTSFLSKKNVLKFQWYYLNFLSLHQKDEFLEATTAFKQMGLHLVELFDNSQVSDFQLLFTTPLITELGELKEEDKTHTVEANQVLNQEELHTKNFLKTLELKTEKSDIEKTIAPSGYLSWLACYRYYHILNPRDSIVDLRQNEFLVLFLARIKQLLYIPIEYYKDRQVKDSTAKKQDKVRSEERRQSVSLLLECSYKLERLTNFVSANLENPIDIDNDPKRVSAEIINIVTNLVPAEAKSSKPLGQNMIEEGCTSSPSSALQAPSPHVWGEGKMEFKDSEPPKQMSKECPSIQPLMDLLHTMLEQIDQHSSLQTYLCTNSLGLRALDRLLFFRITHEALYPAPEQLKALILFLKKAQLTSIQQTLLDYLDTLQKGTPEAEGFIAVEPSNNFLVNAYNTITKESKIGLSPLPLLDYSDSADRGEHFVVWNKLFFSILFIKKQLLSKTPCNPKELTLQCLNLAKANYVPPPEGKETPHFLDFVESWKKQLTRFKFFCIPSTQALQQKYFLDYSEAQTLLDYASILWFTQMDSNSVPFKNQKIIFETAKSYMIRELPLPIPTATDRKSFLKLLVKVCLEAVKKPTLVTDFNETQFNFLLDQLVQEDLKKKALSLLQAYLQLSKSKNKSPITNTDFDSYTALAKLLSGKGEKQTLANLLKVDFLKGFQVINQDSLIKLIPEKVAKGKKKRKKSSADQQNPPLAESLEPSIITAQLEEEKPSAESEENAETVKDSSLIPSESKLESDPAYLEQESSKPSPIPEHYGSGRILKELSSTSPSKSEIGSADSKLQQTESKSAPLSPIPEDGENSDSLEKSSPMALQPNRFFQREQKREAQSSVENCSTILAKSPPEFRAPENKPQEEIEERNCQVSLGHGIINMKTFQCTPEQRFIALMQIAYFEMDEPNCIRSQSTQNLPINDLGYCFAKIIDCDDSGIQQMFIKELNKLFTRWSTTKVIEKLNALWLIHGMTGLSQTIILQTLPALRMYPQQSTPTQLKEFSLFLYGNFLHNFDEDFKNNPDLLEQSSFKKFLSKFSGIKWTTLRAVEGQILHGAPSEYISEDLADILNIITRCHNLHRSQSLTLRDHSFWTRLGTENQTVASQTKCVGYTP